MFGTPPIGYEFVQSGYTLYLLKFCLWGGAEVLRLGTLPEKKTGAPPSQQGLSSHLLHLSPFTFHLSPFTFHLSLFTFHLRRWSFVLLVEAGLFPGPALSFSKTTQQTMRRRATAPADPDISPQKKLGIGVGMRSTVGLVWPNLVCWPDLQD